MWEGPDWDGCKMYKIQELKPKRQRKKTNAGEEPASVLNEIKVHRGS
jgi:hypothetical protein